MSTMAGTATPGIEVRSTSEQSVLSLLKHPADEWKRKNLIPIFLLAIPIWLWSLVLIGQRRNSQLLKAITEVVTPTVLLSVTGALVAAILIYALAGGRKELIGAAAMTGAFLAGNLLFFGPLGSLYKSGGFRFQGLNDGLIFTWNRFLYLIGVSAPLVLTYLIFYRKSGAFPAAWGDWKVRARLVSLKEPLNPYTKQLLEYALFFILPLSILFQLPMKFNPILSGALWPALGAVLIASVVNALVEEILFRGFLQSAFIGAAGVGCGLWITGLLFGLVHWSVGGTLIEALPTAILIGIGSVVWGKSVLDTGGLGWAVTAHALIDIPTFSAFFVR
jgi:membrane protease YdiL (CAAX protease family)